ncbi:MAG: endolytic transglycosylase MltG [Rickettsiales bacterium]
MKKIIIFLTTLLFVALSIAIYSWNSYNADGNLEQATTIILPKGISFIDAVDLLHEKEIISIPPIIFKAVAYLKGDAARIKAGEYIFHSYIAPSEVLNMLVKGDVVIHKITIAEGLNVREISELLNSNDILTGDIPENLEEGSLLPETYYFSRGDSRSSIIERMQRKMIATIDSLWEERAKKLPIKNKKEALTLASIVEKETGVPDERARVAAVFINRLRKGMKLQSDPTTIYGLEKKNGKPLERALIISDLKEPTPYNTYTIYGLPPAPITNPGYEAIKATLNPLKTSELYFVATGDGGHNFSKTLTEHNSNVTKYRIKKKNKK